MTQQTVVYFSWNGKPEIGSKVVTCYFAIGSKVVTCYTCICGFPVMMLDKWKFLVPMGCNVGCMDTPFYPTYPYPYCT